MSSSSTSGPAAPADGPDPYAVLGVPPDATPAQVTAAFRRLARARHPDTSAGPSGPPGLDDVLAAYQTLHDPARRAAHDRAHDRDRDRDRRAVAATGRPTSTQPPAPPPSRQPTARPAAPDLVASPPRRHSAAPPPAASPLLRAGPVVQIRGPREENGR